MLTTVGVLVLPVAAAQADATWSGASTSANWSDSTNWSDAPPTGSTGMLTFPTLGTCGTCYTSNNDLGDVNATSLVLGNSSSQYRITGNGFTVGSGGINDTPGHGTGDVIKAPIALSASQTWVVGHVGSNGYNSLTLLGGISGDSGTAVTLSTPQGDLFVDSDMEAGPVTSNGPGGLHIGGGPGTNQPGSVNGTNGLPVTVNGGFLVANPGSKTGLLRITGGTLLLGTNPHNNGATTLHVTGSATLGSSSITQTYIDNNGSTPGTDFSQLSADDTITLGGTLVLGQGKLNNDTGQCVPLTAGDVATLVTASKSISGTFANAPDGATLTMTSGISCQSTPPKVQINYTADSVTATVLGDTTTKLATPSPSPATTNQTITLTATVTAGGAGASVPDGTVAFLANGSTISGCAGQPLDSSGASGTATCHVSFPANSSPESLSAAFRPNDGSSQEASISSTQSLTVNPAATTAALQASNTSPPAGTNVTYTATVTPGITGASQPSGAIAFLDGGSPISNCAAQPLTSGSPSPTATCTITYPVAGSHTITATYAGDPNFSASSSPPTTVTVQATPTPSGGGSSSTRPAPGGTHPAPGGTNPAPGAGSVTPHGPASLVLSRVAQSRIRWREPHARPEHGVRSVPVGSRFTFTVSSAARVTFRFIQMLPGRRAGSGCAAPSKATQRARACRRARTRGQLVKSVGAGTHHITFSGRLGATTLPAGRYAVVVSAAATSGARSRTITLHFTIVA